MALKNLSVLETQSVKLQSTYYSLSPIDTQKIELRDTSQNSIPFTITRDADLRTYRISADWKDKMTYQFRIGDSAFSDLAGNYIQQQIFRFFGVSRKKAGTLLLRIELPDPGHQSILMLKDNSGKIVQEQISRDSQVVHLDAGLLPAGTYFVEVIEDLNNNGIWNSGDFSSKTLPEKIFKSEKPILIKENWDAEETIRVDFSQKQAIIPNKLSKNLPASNPADKAGQLKSPGQFMGED